MFNSELSIDVSTDLNPKTIRVYDTSTYYVDEKIENYLLEVLPVNKSKWVTFYVKKHFSVVLNSSNLQYRKVTDSSDLAELADGIYEFKQSYKPNATTVIHLYHLRTTSLMRKLYEYREKLISLECKLSRLDYVNNREKLRDIEEYILAAKWKVEERLDKKKGKEMYEWASKMLEHYSNECQCK